ERSRLVTGIEVVSSVESVIADVLECRAMECIRTGFGDDRDLPARASAEFGAVVAAFDVEFLDVLETLRQAEGRGAATRTVDVAGIRVDDRACLDAVVTDDVLLVRASREAHVVEGSAARRRRSRHQQIQLG